MRHRIALTLQNLRMVRAGLLPGQMSWWKLLLPFFLTLWWAGAVDAASHVAGFATYPLAVRLLLGLAMGPSGSMWGSLKALGVLIDAVETPNMAWLVIVPWPPLLLLLTWLFVAGTSPELERRRLQVARSRFRRGTRRKKGGYRS